MGNRKGGNISRKRKGSVGGGSGKEVGDVLVFFTTLRFDMCYTKTVEILDGCPVMFGTTYKGTALSFCDDT